MLDIFRFGNAWFDYFRHISSVVISILETMVSRLECTRVHFVQVSVSVSVSRHRWTWWSVWPMSRPWSRDLKSKVSVLVSRLEDPGLGMVSSQHAWRLRLRPVARTRVHFVQVSRSRPRDLMAKVSGLVLRPKKRSWQQHCTFLYLVKCTYCNSKTVL